MGFFSSHDRHPDLRFTFKIGRVSEETGVEMHTDYPLTMRDCSPEMKELFISLFKDIAEIEGVTVELYEIEPQKRLV